MPDENICIGLPVAGGSVRLVTCIVDMRVAVLVAISIFLLLHCMMPSFLAAFLSDDWHK
jgi:hypothetical protein